MITPVIVYIEVYNKLCNKYCIPLILVYFIKNTLLFIVRKKQNHILLFYYKREAFLKETQRIK